MAGPRIYRRVPADIEQAKRIYALITKDLEGSVLELSQGGKLAELHTKLNDQAEWRGIVDDLTALDGEGGDEAAAASPAPPKRDGAEAKPNEASDQAPPRPARARAATAVAASTDTK